MHAQLDVPMEAISARIFPNAKIETNSKSNLNDLCSRIRKVGSSNSYDVSTKSIKFRIKITSPHVCHHLAVSHQMNKIFISTIKMETLAHF